MLCVSDYNSLTLCTSWYVWDIQLKSRSLCACDKGLTVTVQFFKLVDTLQKRSSGLSCVKQKSEPAEGVFYRHNAFFDLY